MEVTEDDPQRSLPECRHGDAPEEAVPRIEVDGGAEPPAAESGPAIRNGGTGRILVDDGTLDDVRLEAVRALQPEALLGLLAGEDEEPPGEFETVLCREDRAVEPDQVVQSPGPGRAQGCDGENRPGEESLPAGILFEKAS